MSRLRRVTLIATPVIVIALAGVAAYVGISSPWFLAAFLPSSGEVFIAADLHFKPLQSLLNQHQNVSLGKELKSLEPMGVIAAKRVGNAWYVVDLKAPWRGMESYAGLVQDGWQISTHGLLVFTHKGPAEGISFQNVHLSSIINALRNVIRQTQGNAFRSIHPKLVFVLEKDAYPVIDKQYQGIFTYQGRITEGEIRFAPGSLPAIIPNNNGINKLEVAIQRKMLEHTPTNIQGGVYQTITSLLHISRQQDAFKKIILGIDYIKLAQEESHTSLVFSGHSDTTHQLLRNLIETEESYSYPQKRAFRLPDGTLGYELSPSKTTAGWDEASEGCSRLKGKQHEWWVCKENEKVSIGTSRGLSIASIREELDINNWSINLPLHELTEALDSSNEGNLEIVGNKQGASIQIR